jgi:isopropylmalate/homocitrate/citramalate synthase
MLMKEPAQPEYFTESFPRDTFPAYAWTERPASLPQEVWTTETTHGDGRQGGLPLTTEQGLAIYNLHCHFTGASGAIRQAEFFVYQPSDRATLKGALERYQSGAPIEPMTLIRATAKDVALIRSLGVRETGMLASASDFHAFHKFTPGGRNQAAQTYLEAVQMALDAGIRPRLHLEDATRAPMDFMVPFVEAVLAMSASYGSELRHKFRVCATRWDSDCPMTMSRCRAVSRV